MCTRVLTRVPITDQLMSEGITPDLRALEISAESIFKVNCHVACDNALRIPDENVARHLYRIAQEAVYNAVKHSRGRSVQIQFAGRNGSLMLTVKDDGHGFPKSSANPAGMGLQIIN